MNSSEAGELAIFILCITALIAYNVLYFTSWFQSLRFRWRDHCYLSIWSVGSEAKSVWLSAMISDPKEGITTAQTIRNMVMGVSILAAGITLLAGQLLLLLTDPVRLDQLSKYSQDDPISGGSPLMAPQVKLGIALGVLLLSLISMTQCVRLSVHLSYIIRAAPVDPKRQLRFAKIAFAINRRSSLFFSVGLRVQYAFFPIFLFILGPLALLLSTVIEIVALFIMDLTPDDLAYANYVPQSEEAEVERVMSDRLMEKKVVAERIDGGERDPAVLVD